MKLKKLISILALCLLLSGCSGDLSEELDSFSVIDCDFSFANEKSVLAGLKAMKDAKQIKKIILILDTVTVGVVNKLFFSVGACFFIIHRAVGGKGNLGDRESHNHRQEN